jgi:hypothetical protein
MKIKTYSFIVLFCIVLVCIVAYSIRPSGPTRKMVVEISGTPGIKVAGTYKADGRTFDFSGVVPASIEVEAARLKYTIKKLGAEGDLEGTLFVDDKALGKSKTSSPLGGVTGNYSPDGSMVSTVSPDE